MPWSRKKVTCSRSDSSSSSSTGGGVVGPLSQSSDTVRRPTSVTATTSPVCTSSSNPTRSVLCSAASETGAGVSPGSGSGGGVFTSLTSISASSSTSSTSGTEHTSTQNTTRNKTTSNHTASVRRPSLCSTALNRSRATRLS